jgi:antitoxin ParD1/3/4
MNISLSPELEQLVTDKVKTGVYQTASDVIREGLRLLRERDERLQALRQSVRDGFEAVERGEYTDFDEETIGDLAKRVKNRGLKRISAETPTASTR